MKAILTLQKQSILQIYTEKVGCMLYDTKICYENESGGCLDGGWGMVDDFGWRSSKQREALCKTSRHAKRVLYKFYILKQYLP